MKLFEISRHTYYHGASQYLPVGTILRGRGDDYADEWGDDKFYQILEYYRPKNMLAHKESVFMTDNDIDYKAIAEQLAKRHGVSLTTINKQLRMGIKVELEHTTSRSEAREIALDHLREMPDYYSRLADMERSGGVTEAFDSPPAAFNILRKTPDEIEYEFEYHGESFFVEFHKWSKDYWEFEFGTGILEPYKPTGRGGANPIYATVIAIVQDFLKRDDWVSRLRFEGDKDNKLASLYDVMIRVLAKKLHFQYEKDDRDSRVIFDIYLEYDTHLGEAFDSPVQYTQIPKGSPRMSVEGIKGYTFSVGDTQYSIYFTPYPNDRWNTVLAKHTVYSNVTYQPSRDSSPNNVFTVYATVVKIIADFIQSHKVHTITFDGSKDTNLSNVYDRIVKNLSRRYNYTYDISDFGPDHLYTINVNDGINEATKPWLRVTPEMKRQARDLKTQLIVEMPTSIFLELTTNEHTTPASIKANARDIRDYNRWAKAGDDKDFRSRLNKGKSDEDDDFVWGTIHMPWLTIQLSPDGSEGRVVGHEGRHRIAASMNVGNRTERVALQIKVGEDMFPDVSSGAYAHITDEHLPKTIISQYNKYRKYSTDRWIVVDNNVLRL